MPDKPPFFQRGTELYNLSNIPWVKWIEGPEVPTLRIRVNSSPKSEQGETFEIAGRSAVAVWRQLGGGRIPRNDSDVVAEMRAEVRKKGWFPTQKRRSRRSGPLT